MREKAGRQPREARTESSVPRPEGADETRAAARHPPALHRHATERATAPVRLAPRAAPQLARGRASPRQCEKRLRLAAGESDR